MLMVGIIAKWAHVEIVASIVENHKCGGIHMQGHHLSRQSVLQ